MKANTCCLLVFTMLACACSGQKEADGEPPAPRPAAPAPTQAATPLAERPPIDPGDVDSGIMILGTLAPESVSATTQAEYIETARETLSMTIITARPPFPEKLLIQFEMTSSRDFVERPVVARARAYRDNDTPLGEEHAYVMGRNARRPEPDESGMVIPRAFVVDALEGLEAPPDTMLVYARADAWLMETGTDENALDPRTATSPERVTLISNPVRINFEKEETP